MKKIFPICFLYIFQTAYADVPLTVENIISEKGKLTAELGLTYGNNKIRNAEITGYIPVQVSDTSFVNIPTVITNQQVQNEYVVTNIGVKYGLFENLDLSLKSNFIYSSNRFLNLESIEKSQTKLDISDISIGMNYQFIYDDIYPAIVGFFETTAFEKSYNNLNFSNYTFGLTTYRSYDPIVLSLTIGYKHSLKRKFDKKNYFKPSDLFFLNPQVAFSANDRVSLLAGLNFKHLGDQKLNNSVIIKKINSLDYSFGMGYGLNDNSNFNLIANIRQDFDNSSEIRLIYNKKILI